MSIRDANRKFFGGIFVFVCALLIVVVRLDGWARYGEKLQLGVAAILFSLSAVLIALSHRRKEDD